MKWVEAYLNRKNQRRVPVTPHPLEEKFTQGGLMTTQPGDNFVIDPQTAVISIPLNSHNSIYQHGFWHQDGDEDNLPTVRGDASVDGGDCLEIIADKEGLHSEEVSTFMPNDNGQLSVWVKGGGSASEEDYEYVISVHELNDDATPDEEETFVIRWEYDDGATPVHSLRFYPDLTNFPDTYVEIELSEADWQDAEWHKVLATWSYQNQAWTLKWDDTKGTLVQPEPVDIVPWPEWTQNTKCEVFTDCNFENVVYHYVAHLVFGPITDPDALGIVQLQPLIFYFDDIADASGIPGYKTFCYEIPEGPEATLTRTGKNTDGEMLLGSFITHEGHPGVSVLPAGSWNWHIYAHVDNITKESYIKFYMYKRSAAGVETLLFNCQTADVNDIAVTLQHFTYTHPTPITLLPTDRLVCKAYFYTTRPANVQMTFTYDGLTHASHVHSPFASPITPREKSTYVVSYSNSNPSGSALLLGFRLWQDENVAAVGFVAQVDYPRRITITCLNLDILTNMTGTVTINGFDADGVTIQEILTVNVPPGPAVPYMTNYCFAFITSITTDQTDAHLGDQYSMGASAIFGVPNYPLAAAGDVFKATLGGVDTAILAVNTTYGAVTLGGVIIAPVDLVMFYRSAK